MFVATQNVLDFIESIGRQAAAMASPNYWAYEDRARAKAYEPQVEACRRAWSLIRGGAEAGEVVRWLSRKLNGNGFGINILIRAIDGELNTTLEDACVPNGRRIRRVTVDGDLFTVNYGDRLNLPSVSRMANEYLPKDRRRVDGSQAIASLMPNPCTRISRPVSVW